MPEHLTEAPIDVAALLREVQSPGAGAVVLFLGNVRDSHAGKAVRAIHYSGYRRMAERSLGDIERALALEHAANVRIVHRLGDVAVGEASVAIATAAPHRAAAYAASRSALERLKSEIPIWKRELYTDGGEAWREEEPLVR